ncbi:hypothetical protein, partial [Glaesserella parasuis]|uniref:hypothetical protein n=1 Tax=Glaesserella parasuis TaxID=738 RepID=UPI003852599A
QVIVFGGWFGLGLMFPSFTLLCVVVFVFGAYCGGNYYLISKGYVFIRKNFVSNKLIENFGGLN